MYSIGYRSALMSGIGRVYAALDATRSGLSVAKTELIFLLLQPYMNLQLA